jgi:glc operon protein GlcG
MKSRFVMTILVGALFATAISPSAEAQLPNAYGPSIGVESARKLAATAIAEGKKNGWNVAVAIVDPAGDLVFFERMDNTQAAATIVSQEKARTAARFKRPSKAFEDALAGGRQAILGLPGVTPLEGGIPLVVEGKIVGAIGVSGATSPQDGVCAQAAADTLGKQPTLPPPATPKPPATPTPPVKK